MTEVLLAQVQGYFGEAGRVHDPKRSELLANDLKRISRHTMEDAVRAVEDNQK